MKIRLIIIFVLSSFLAYSSKIGITRQRLEKPLLAILTLEQPVSGDYEYERTIELEKLLPPCSREAGWHYFGSGSIDKTICVALTGYKTDNEHEGVIILSFDIVCNTEVFKVQDISWNQEDDLVVCCGDSWMVKLTRHKEFFR